MQLNRPLRTIRGRLLLSANLTFGVFLVVLLMVNARREYSNSVAAQASSLKDEAVAIHTAIGHLLQVHGPDSIQEYVDDLTRGMQGSHGADHSILVQVGSRLIAPSGTMRVAPQQLLEALRTLEHASSNHVSVNNRTFVVGSVAAPRFAVHVFEESASIRRAIRRDVVVQLVALAALGLVMAAVMNVVLFWRIAAPLQQLSLTVKRIADGEFGLRAGNFQGAEFQELADAVTSMSCSLADEHRRRAASMREARAIQQHLLPATTDLPGLQTATLFLPADDVAGDYIDILPLDDGTWIICIADVMGHGVPAAMGAAMLKTLLMTAVEKHAEPPRILEFINHRFAQSLPSGYFASAFVGRWFPDSRLLQYSNAGHGPALLTAADGETRSMPSTGLIIGLDERASWHMESFAIHCGDRLVLLTDGITEARSPAGELFGAQRLLKCLESRHDCPPHATVECIRDAIAEHRGGLPVSDDCTLLVLGGVCATAGCCSLAHSTGPLLRADAPHSATRFPIHSAVAAENGLKWEDGV